MWEGERQRKHPAEGGTKGAGQRFPGRSREAAEVLEILDERRAWAGEEEEERRRMYRRRRARLREIWLPSGMFGYFSIDSDTRSSRRI